MRRSKFYNMRLPERGAREGEANDAADIEDLTYDLEIIDKEMERQRLEDVRMEKEKATKLELSQHKSAAVLDHPDNSVTDAKLGQRTVLTTSGPLQTLLTAIGNAIKAISGADTWNGTPATTLKDAKTHMGDAVKHITAQEREIWNAAATDRHSHTNKSVLDSITAAMVTAWNTVSSKLPLAGGTLTGFLTLHAAPATDMHAATKKYVDDKMAASGSGDMTKAVYDPGGRELPYIPKQDVDALAWGGDFGASGAPVSIAYAGTNRIASITAYGETPQGGTVEAPVALTGISSITVNDDVTELPIPRPLHEVGDVRDVCRTRVKSVYDKRVVLDGTENNLVYNEEYSTLLVTGITTAGSTTADNVYGVCASSHFSLVPVGSVSSGRTDIIWSQPRLNQLVIRSPKFNSLETAKAYFAAQKAAGTPVVIYYQSTAYDGTNGLDVCMTEYQTGFVELDGTETWAVYTGDGYNIYLAYYPATGWTEANRDKGVCSHYIVGPYNPSLKRVRGPGGSNLDGTVQLVDSQFATVDDLKAYLVAQKAAGTPVQVAYQLATPEVYATDPLDIDNAAGPLTVMTGGELEVRMTELVGSRSPELTAKMDKATYDADGDGVVDRAGSVDGGTY